MQKVKKNQGSSGKNRQQKTNKPPDSQKKGKGKFEYQNISKTRAKVGLYDSIATVGEIRVYWRADFQSGSRVLKKVF